MKLKVQLPINGDLKTFQVDTKSMEIRVKKGSKLKKLKRNGIPVTLSSLVLQPDALTQSFATVPAIAEVMNKIRSSMGMGGGATGGRMPWEQPQQPTMPWEQPQQQQPAMPWEKPQQPAMPWEQSLQGDTMPWEKPRQENVFPWDRPQQRNAGVMPWDQPQQRNAGVMPWDQPQQQQRPQPTMPWDQPQSVNSFGQQTQSPVQENISSIFGSTEPAQPQASSIFGSLSGGNSLDANIPTGVFGQTSPTSIYDTQPVVGESLYTTNGGLDLPKPASTPMRQGLGNIMGGNIVKRPMTPIEFAIADAKGQINRDQVNNAPIPVVDQDMTGVLTSGVLANGSTVGLLPNLPYYELISNDTLYLGGYTVPELNGDVLNVISRVPVRQIISKTYGKLPVQQRPNIANGGGGAMGVNAYKLPEGHVWGDITSAISRLRPDADLASINPTPFSFDPNCWEQIECPESRSSLKCYLRFKGDVNNPGFLTYNDPWVSNGMIGNGSTVSVIYDLKSAERALKALTEGLNNATTEQVILLHPLVRYTLDTSPDFKDVVWCSGEDMMPEERSALRITSMPVAEKTDFTNLTTANFMLAPRDYKDMIPEDKYPRTPEEIEAKAKEMWNADIPADVLTHYGRAVEADNDRSSKNSKKEGTLSSPVYLSMEVYQNRLDYLDPNISERIELSRWSMAKAKRSKDDETRLTSYLFKYNVPLDYYLFDDANGNLSEVSVGVAGLLGDGWQPIDQDVLLSEAYPDLSVLNPLMYPWNGWRVPTKIITDLRNKGFTELARTLMDMYPNDRKPSKAYIDDSEGLPGKYVLDDEDGEEPYVFDVDESESTSAVTTFITDREVSQEEANDSILAFKEHVEQGGLTETPIMEHDGLELIDSHWEEPDLLDIAAQRDEIVGSAALGMDDYIEEIDQDDIVTNKEVYLIPGVINTAIEKTLESSDVKDKTHDLVKLCDIDPLSIAHVSIEYHVQGEFDTEFNTSAKGKRILTLLGKQVASSYLNKEVVANAIAEGSKEVEVESSDVITFKSKDDLDSHIETVVEALVEKKLESIKNIIRTQVSIKMNEFRSTQYTTVSELSDTVVEITREFSDILSKQKTMLEAKYKGEWYLPEELPQVATVSDDDEVEEHPVSRDVCNLKQGLIANIKTVVGRHTTFPLFDFDCVRDGLAKLDTTTDLVPVIEHLIESAMLIDDEGTDDFVEDLNELKESVEFMLSLIDDGKLPDPVDIGKVTTKRIPKLGEALHINDPSVSLSEGNKGIAYSKVVKFRRGILDVVAVRLGEENMDYLVIDMDYKQE